MFDLSFTLESTGLIESDFEYTSDYVFEGLGSVFSNIKEKVKRFISGLIDRIRNFREKIKGRLSRKAKSAGKKDPLLLSAPSDTDEDDASSRKERRLAEIKARREREQGRNSGKDVINLPGATAPSKAQTDDFDEDDTDDEDRSSSRRRIVGREIEDGATVFKYVDDDEDRSSSNSRAKKKQLKGGKQRGLPKVTTYGPGGVKFTSRVSPDFKDLKTGRYTEKDPQGGRTTYSEPKWKRDKLAKERQRKAARPIANIINNYTKMCEAACKELVGWFLTVENLAENREGKKASTYGIVGDSEKLENMIDKLKEYEETARSAGEFTSASDGAAAIKSLNEAERQLMGIKNRVVEKLDRLGSNNAAAVKKVADKCMDVARRIAGAINIIETAMRR